jgi:exodeoxyribonuclease V alpha subunit
MESIEGTVISTIYRSADGYTVLEIDGKFPTTVVGNLPEIKTGEYVRFFGEFKEHKTYGLQFAALSCESSLPADVNDIALFLSGGFIKGLGEVLSRRITEAFGEDTFRVIEEEPELLSKVRGVSKKLAFNIHDAFSEYTESKQSYAKLMGIGLTAKQAMAAYSSLGAGAAESIRNNPYLLISAVRGIDFITADNIAENIGITAEHPLRLQSGLLHILRKSLERGYTNVPEQMLIGTAVSKLGAEKEKIEAALNSLTLARVIVRKKYTDGYFVFLRPAYDAEHYSAVRLISMLICGASRNIDDVDKKLERQREKYSLSEDQINALKTAVESPVSVITGGPGTGKTTILKSLVNILSASGCTFSLCAPTGRAAKRMQQACGAEAFTIHRLLEYSYDKDDNSSSCVFRRNKKNPLSCDTLIVDEASMIDIFIFRSMLEALGEGARLVIVGDANQLPSVGAGSVMEDIIESGVIPVARLTHIYRHDGGIADAAHAVLIGKMPDFTHDFVFYEEDDVSSIILKAADMYEECFKNGEDVQMLCPVKNGVIGSGSLDALLRERVNAASPQKTELEYMGKVYRVNDRVMQIKNNYSKKWYTKSMSGEGVFNGDIGEITNIGAGSVFVDFDGRIAMYEAQELPELSGAYAYTVHKSQGNEFDTVILPMKYPDMPFFSRNLLYTAVTRAKKRAVIIGSRHTFEYMVSNAQKDKRYTALKKELLKNSKIFL